MARSDILPGDQVLGLTLDRYQEIMRFPIAAFNGLHKADEAGCYDCAAIWKQTDRDGMALALAQAEQMREHELGYFLSPKYVVGDEYDYEFPLILTNKYLIAVGTRRVDVIESGASLTLRDLGGNIIDPVVVVTPTTVTNPDEICVYYPNEDIEIHPSKVTISGGNATIEIPRSRLVSPSVDTNCEPPPEYDDDTNFLATVDVKHCYTVEPGAYFYWFGNQCDIFSVPNLSTANQSAYARIVSSRLSIVKLYPGVYAGGIWSGASMSYCYQPTFVRVSYLSGIRSSSQTELDTARLAHTLLPNIIPDRVDLCSGCWKGDMERDTSQLVTPYGMSTGAIAAWMADSRSKIGQGGKFPRVRGRTVG